MAKFFKWTLVLVSYHGVGGWEEGSGVVIVGRWVVVVSRWVGGKTTLIHC